MAQEKPIILPLDGMDEARALDMASRLRGEAWGSKVNDLLVACGVDIVCKLKEFGLVFADPKFKDIPDTVKRGTARLVAAGADLITVHASGGIDMMRAAVKETKGTSTKILAITVLTSLDDDDCVAIHGAPVNPTVLEFARMAMLAGVHGIVCSGAELGMLRKHEELNGLMRVTPGMRPIWYKEGDDQKRVMAPEEAVKLGADLLVIGRPIFKATNPLQATQHIMADIEGREWKGEVA